MRKVKIKLFYCMLFLFMIIKAVNAQTIIYSEKFYLDTTEENNIIEIPVKIRNVNNLYGFRFDLSYDNPSIITYNSISEGGFLSQDGAEIISSEELGLLNISSGNIENIIFTRKSTDTGVSGDGTLVNISFQKLNNGVIEFTLSNIELSDPDSVEINYELYYLTIWDDTDTVSREVGEDVTFYAGLTDEFDNPVQTNCEINLNGDLHSLNYQNSRYEFSSTFTSSGVFPWSVTCDNFYTMQDTYIINEAQEEEEEEEDTGGGGGGGGGGFFTTCTSDWHCTDWQPYDCPSTGVQTRECIDQKYKHENVLTKMIVIFQEWKLKDVHIFQ